VRYGDQVRIRSTVTEVKDKTFRVEHGVSVGDRQCAAGFEVRAWVARPDEPGARLAATPFPEEIAMRLKGQGGIYA
jgi:acyl-CoA thioester hydrolase